MPKIIIPTPLRKFTDQNRTFESSKTTVQEAIRELVEAYPDLRKNLLDEEGHVRSFIKLYVGDDEVDTQNEESVEVESDTVISIVPAIAGGCPCLN